MTDRQTDSQRNDIFSLASRGLEGPAHASRGLEDFSVVCLAGCAVVIPAITTGKKKVPVVCLAGCQFLVLAITTGKKKSSSSHQICIS